MPYSEVMPKFKRGELHSGSKSGPKVTKRSQAIAIMLSEKRAAQEGKKEYQPKKYQKGGTVDPDARAAPYSKEWTEPIFPYDSTQSPAVRQLSPSYGKERERDKIPQPDYPSHSVAVKKGGEVKRSWRRW